MALGALATLGSAAALDLAGATYGSSRKTAIEVGNPMQRCRVNNEMLACDGGDSSATFAVTSVVSGSGQRYLTIKSGNKLCKDLGTLSSDGLSWSNEKVKCSNVAAVNQQEYFKVQSPTRGGAGAVGGSQPLPLPALLGSAFLTG